MSRKVFSFFFLAGVIAGFFAFAWAPPAAEAAFPYWGEGGILSCSGLYCGDAIGGLPEGTRGPCKSVCDIIATGQNVLYLALTILMLVIVPVLIAVSGIMMMVSAGKPETFNQGKAIGVNTVIALLLGLAAFVIVNTIFWVLGITLGAQGTWYDWDCKPENLPGTLGEIECPDLSIPAGGGAAGADMTYACVSTTGGAKIVTCTTPDDTTCAGAAGSANCGGNGRCQQVKVAECNATHGGGLTPTTKFGCWKLSGAGNGGYRFECASRCSDLQGCITQFSGQIQVPTGVPGAPGCQAVKPEACGKTAGEPVSDKVYGCWTSPPDSQGNGGVFTCRRGDSSCGSLRCDDSPESQFGACQQVSNPEQVCNNL